MSSIVRRSNLSGDLPSAIVETADTPHRRQCNRVSVDPEKEYLSVFLLPLPSTPMRQRRAFASLLSRVARYARAELISNCYKTHRSCELAVEIRPPASSNSFSGINSVVSPAVLEAYRDRSVALLHATLRHRAIRLRAASREILQPTARSVGRRPRG